MASYKNLGAVTSYKVAVDNGYTGTIEDWVELIQSIPTYAETAGTSASEAAAAQAAAEAVLASIPEDYTELSEDVDELKSDKVDTDLMQKCEIVEVEASANLWDADSVTTGLLHTNGTIYTGDSYDNYCYNDIGEVSEGDIISAYRVASSGIATMTMARVVAYDSDGNVLSSSGGTSVTTYTVPSGVASLKVTITNMLNALYPMIFINAESAPTSYVAYQEAYSYYIASDEFIENTSALTATSLRSGYMQRVLCNLIDPTFPDTAYSDGGGMGCYVDPSTGSLIENSAYWTTDYIAVNEGETLYLFNGGLSAQTARFVCAYDSDYSFVASASSVASYTVPSGASYIRFSKSFSTSWTYYLPEHFMLCGTDTPSEFIEYDSTLVDAYEFLPSLIPDTSTSADLHVYLPPEICVGVGRTIELYNELVCLEANKYHMYWSGGGGIQYARKYSITGSTTGSSTLTLQIYNDDMEMVWTGTTTVYVVENSISSALNILPIGDSLTNLKAWLSEVQSLSDSMILYIGTRGRSDSAIRHEGRSSFSAADYNADTEYDFDSNYQGSSDVDETANPFWDSTNSRFSLTYYNTMQSSTVGTADAVQLFLGTNDVFGDYTADEAAQNIIDLIDEIRTDDSTIPIFVCNTIYRSNQSGYYSSGSDGYTGASGWAYESDIKIMALQNALDTAISDGGYTNVYIVPLSVCMDRENDFGQVEVAVNPRLTDVTETIPSESVHPQEAGYLQMADVMYSSYIAHLS